jgi:hypothetical protein
MGVKGKFVDVYAGTGDGSIGTGAAIARDFANAFGDQAKSVPGYVKPFKAC